MFLRRLGTNDHQQCVHGQHCPQVLEKLDGNFAVVGQRITEEGRKLLPPGPGIGSNEEMVEVPRAVMMAAMADFLATAAA